MDDGIEGTYTPNTAPVAPVLKPAEPVPTLMVVFRCPRCGGGGTRDAYRGMPKCEGDALDGTIPRHPPTRMEAVCLA